MAEGPFSRFRERWWWRRIGTRRRWTKGWHRRQRLHQCKCWTHHPCRWPSHTPKDNNLLADPALTPHPSQQFSLDPGGQGKKLWTSCLYFGWGPSDRPPTPKNPWSSSIQTIRILICSSFDSPSICICIMT
eukprot:1010980-Pelagomonas_calceolata.AAC.1